jgi:hypothetical protein
MNFQSTKIHLRLLVNSSISPKHMAIKLKILQHFLKIIIIFLVIFVNILQNVAIFCKMLGHCFWKKHTSRSSRTRRHSHRRVWQPVVAGERADDKLAPDAADHRLLDSIEGGLRNNSRTSDYCRLVISKRTLDGDSSAASSLYS